MKFTDESAAMEKEARAFLTGYTGQFAFLLQLRQRIREGKTHLTPRQIEAILRCKARESKQGHEVDDLWRVAVKLTHPDRAIDPGDRLWRERLTVKANIARDAKDVAALRWLVALISDE